MLIKENELARKTEIEHLKNRIQEMAESEITLKKTIQDLETEICDKNKVCFYHHLTTSYRLHHYYYFGERYVGDGR